MSLSGMSRSLSVKSRKARLVIAGTIAALSVLAPLQALADEITVTIKRVKSLDVIDAASQPDFMARVTIAGKPFETKPIMNQADIRPTDWVFSASVQAGTHDVKIQIVDKDVAVNDSIDINRIDGKRDLDFAVNTRRCMVTGFSVPYRCGASIVREGQEKKRAEITFSVDAKR